MEGQVDGEAIVLMDLIKKIFGPAASDPVTLPSCCRNLLAMKAK